MWTLTHLPRFPFKWNDAVSCTFHEKKDPNGAVLNGTMGLLLSLDVRGRGRRRSFFYRLFSPSFSEKHQKDVDYKPTCITSDPWPTTRRWKKEGTCPSGCFWGGCIVAAPTSLSLVFPMNTGEERAKKGPKKGKEREKKGRDSEENKKPKERKKRKNKEK